MREEGLDALEAFSSHNGPHNVRSGEKGRSIGQIVFVMGSSSHSEGARRETSTSSRTGRLTCVPALEIIKMASMIGSPEENSHCGMQPVPGTRALGGMLRHGLALSRSPPHPKPDRHTRSHTHTPAHTYIGVFLWRAWRERENGLHGYAARGYEWFLIFQRRPWNLGLARPWTSPYANERLASLEYVKFDSTKIERLRVNVSTIQSS